MEAVYESWMDTRYTKWIGTRCQYERELHSDEFDFRRLVYVDSIEVVVKAVNVSHQPKSGLYGTVGAAFVFVFSRLVM